MTLLNTERPAEQGRAVRSVGLVAPGWPPTAFTNGIVTYVANIRGGLEACGVDVHILAGEVKGEADGQVVALTNGTPPGVWQRVLRRASLLVRPEQFHARCVTQPILTYVQRLTVARALDLLEMEESFGWAGTVAARAAVPVVSRLHGPWFLNGRALGVAEDRRFLRRLANEKVGILAASAVSAPSQDVLERTRSFYDIELEDAEVIPNPIAAVPASARWRLEDCNRRQILFVGRFDRHKGGDLALEVLARLLKDDPDLQLVFVGPDGGYRDSAGRCWGLREYVSERLRLAPDGRQVQWLGPRAATEINELRRASFLTLVTSRYENFPMVGLEAMAHGCPVVAAATGGLRELFETERNGLLAKADDVDDLTRAARVLLKNPAFAAQLGRQAGLDAETRYNPDGIARQTLEFYERVHARWVARFGRGARR